MVNFTVVQEALCRVIARAERWQTIDEAWSALINAERIDRGLHQEAKEDTGRAGCSGSGRVEKQREGA